MLIRKLKLDYFGKFSGKEIDLEPGINLIYGENEAGKSTLHSFIKGMLFGIERLRGRGAASREDIYTRYLPWDYPGAYGGQMDIQLGDRVYRLRRSFHANDRFFTITDRETGREIKLKDDHISDLIPGLTESTFRNTISIEQLKAATDGELAGQVRNYITNLSIARSREVNVEKAINHLKEKKKALESIPYTLRLKTLADEIEEAMAIEEKIDSLTVNLKNLEADRIRIKKKLDMLRSSDNQKEEELMAGLPAILEKYGTYDELIKQYANLKDQIDELEEKLISWENEANIASGLKNDLNEAQMLDLKCVKYRERLQELTKELEEESRKSKRRNLLYISITIATSLLGFIVSRSVLPTMGLLLIFLLIRGFIYIFSNKKGHTLKQVNELQVNDLNREKLKAEVRINHILNTYQATTLFELTEKLEEYYKTLVSLEHGREHLSELYERMKNLEDKSDQLHDTIMLYMSNFISEEELTAEAMARLEDAVNIRKKQVQEEQNELVSQLSNINMQIEKIRWELSQVEDNETRLISNREEYAHLLQKQKENEEELAAINLAIDTIQELSSTIHDNFGKKFNQAVSDIISELTDRKYQDLKIDEKLNIKLEWNDNYIILDRLSAGTIDQVYFALRLAVADLLLGQDRMPLILDDSFALYDDKRIKAALLQIANRSQVIIFTCQMREKKLLEELGLSFNYIKL